MDVVWISVRDCPYKNGRNIPLADYLVAWGFFSIFANEYNTITI